MTITVSQNHGIETLYGIKLVSTIYDVTLWLQPGPNPAQLLSPQLWQRITMGLGCYHTDRDSMENKLLFHCASGTTWSWIIIRFSFVTEFGYELVHVSLLALDQFHLSFVKELLHQSCRCSWCAPLGGNLRLWVIGYERLALVQIDRDKNLVPPKCMG